MGDSSLQKFSTKALQMELSTRSGITCYELLPGQYVEIKIDGEHVQSDWGPLIITINED